MAGKPLVVILGPTAVGKTGAAIALAEAFRGEIVSADSRQIYRRMNIGTAKPTLLQQAQIPHHLIDVVEPDDRLSLAQYQALARQAINQIQDQGKLPFLVGGTGQYITALIEGWSIPEVPPNEALRRELEHIASTSGGNTLHKRLQELDPTAAAQIDSRNVRRVIRALEVCLETGLPFSRLQRKTPPDYNILHIGLTMERQALYAQADQRIDHMIHDGFIKEVQELLENGYNRKLPSMSGLGYAELTAHLLDGVDLDEAIARTKHNTHDFIRRQYTWFRGHDPGILWHNMSSTIIETLVETLERWQQGTR